MADTGHGITLTFESGFATNIESLNWTGVSRTAIPTTHFGTSGGKTFIPSDTVDFGSLNVTFQHSPTGTLPILQAASAWTVTYPGNETLAGSGFITGYGHTYEDEGVTMVEAEIKITGNVTGNLTVS